MKLVTRLSSKSSDSENNLQKLLNLRGFYFILIFLSEVVFFWEISNIPTIYFSICVNTEANSHFHFTRKNISLMHSFSYQWLLLWQDLSSRGSRYSDFIRYHSGVKEWYFSSDSFFSISFCMVIYSISCSIVIFSTRLVQRSSHVCHVWDFSYFFSLILFS